MDRAGRGDVGRIDRGRQPQAALEKFAKNVPANGVHKANTVVWSGANFEIGLHAGTQSFLFGGDLSSDIHAGLDYGYWIALLSALCLLELLPIGRTVAFSSRCRASTNFSDAISRNCGLMVLF
jgi:hypothetical protein